MAQPAQPAPANQQLLADQAEFLLYQKYLQEKFWLYRTGDDYYKIPLDVIKADYEFDINRGRLLRIRARQVPRVHYRRLDRNAKRVIRAPWAEINRVFYKRPDPNVNPLDNLGDVIKRLGNQEVARTAAIIGVAKKNFAFIKVLGAGGNGMVVLWKWDPLGKPQDGGIYVVMKISILRDNNWDIVWQDIDDEHAMTAKFLRAPHIAQVVFFTDRVPPRPNTRKTRSTNQVEIATNLDVAPGLLFLEYARLGDLRTFIQKLVDRDRHLPPEALWRLFDCLVKACNAMEYPPNRSAVGPPRAGAPLPEDIRPHDLASKGLGWAGVVHFDLDPKNVLVVGYDQDISNDPRYPDHTQMPMFQVGDFGIAKTGAWCWRQTARWPGMTAEELLERRSETWHYREMAKAGWFLPEQFSSEWDQYDRAPDEGPANSGVVTPWDLYQAPFSGPGRYSSKSNIWHVGMNMFCTLLLQWPDFPPVAGRMRSAEPTHLYDPIPARHERWTYGYRLIEDSQEGREYRNRFTPLLCETIAKCLMAKQEHRPNLIELQAIIRQAIGNAPARLPDDVKAFFGDDAPPPVPWYGDYMDIDLEEMDIFNPYPYGVDQGAPTPTPRPRRRRGRRRHAPLEERAYRP